MQIESRYKNTRTHVIYIYTHAYGYSTFGFGRMHAHSHADIVSDQRHLGTKFWAVGRMSAWLPMIGVNWTNCINQGVVMCKSVHRAVDGTYAHASDNRPRSWQPDQQWEWHGMTYCYWNTSTWPVCHSRWVCVHQEWPCWTVFSGSAGCALAEFGFSS